MGLDIKELINMNQDQLFNACYNNTAISALLLLWGFSLIIFLVIGLLLLKKDSYGKFMSIYFISVVLITSFLLVLIFIPGFSKGISDFFAELFSF